MRTPWMLVALLVGCAPAPLPPPAPVPGPVGEPAAESAPAVSASGTYRLEASSAPSECGGKLVLAARHIKVDAGAGLVSADVVDRTYSIVKSDPMVAEGNFEVDGACPGTKVFERWTLAREANGNLAGTLESRWNLPPECQRPCLVKFPITAVRVD